ALVFHELEALREGQILGVGQNDVGATRRIEHDFGFFEFRNVVIEVTNPERVRRHETVTARFVATFNAIDIERNYLRFFGFWTKCRDDGVQWAHPRDRTWRRRVRAPTHRLRPREG